MGDFNSTLSPNERQGYVLMGDVNSTLSLNEHHGYDGSLADSMDFVDWTQTHRLIDLENMGKWFTSICREKMVQHDHFLATDEWINVHPDYKPNTLPFHDSDHCPITIDISYGKKPVFRVTYEDR